MENSTEHYNMHVSPNLLQRLEQVVPQSLPLLRFLLQPECEICHVPKHCPFRLENSELQYNNYSNIFIYNSNHITALQTSTFDLSFMMSTVEMTAVLREPKYTAYYAYDVIEMCAAAAPPIRLRIRTRSLNLNPKP